MDNPIIEAIKSGKIHLQSQDRYRRMFYADGVWEVWGKDYKDDRQSHRLHRHFAPWREFHIIGKSPDVGIALKALLGEKE